MTESKQLTLSARVDQARSLQAALGLAPEALGSMALTLLDRTEALFGIKDSTTGRYVHANARLQAVWERELEGLRDEDVLTNVETLSALRAADQSAMLQTLPQVSEHRLDLASGRREYSVTRMPLQPADATASARYLACVWLDVTAQRQADVQLQQAFRQLEEQQRAHEAMRVEMQDHGLRDGVTGLFQGGHFEEQLRREVDLSSREHREFSLVSIAVDPLGTAAEALGPQARSRILEALGRLLRSNTRAMDSSGHLQGDLFAILLSGVGLATAHARMEGLRRQCATQIVLLNGQNLGFTVSMGVASFPHTAHTQDELLHAASAALGQAQRRGGNHVSLASIRFEAQ